MLNSRQKLPPADASADGAFLSGDLSMTNDIRAVLRPARLPLPRLPERRSACADLRHFCEPLPISCTIRFPTAAGRARFRDPSCVRSGACFIRSVSGIQTAFPQPAFLM
jgi:hypothetical protein